MLAQAGLRLASVFQSASLFRPTSFTTMGATMLRAGAIVIAIRHGHGLLAVAAITVLMPLISGLVNAIVVLSILPLRLSIKNFNRESVRRIATYSSSTLIIIVAARLRFKTDAMVIGKFVGAAAITYFTIGLPSV